MNNINAPFKIIGLRVYEQCDEQLRKVIKPNITYFFCNDYEDDGDDGIRKKANCQELSPTFFCIHDKGQGPLVNISCIVGHNGDGKSSLIELLIRIINNFAYFSGFRSDHPDLKFIPGVYSKLYFLANNTICCINCFGKSVEFIAGKESYEFRHVNDFYSLGERKKKKEVLKIAENLFFTLISNYSLYAYNANDFKTESSFGYPEDWLTELFSKNDAYQIPLILMPYRENGVIDVNREYQLSVRRLGELFLDCKKGNFMISDTERVEGFVYRIDSESKLLTETIKEYLLNESLDSRKNIRFESDFSKNRPSIDFSNEEVQKIHISFWDKFDMGFFKLNLLELANVYIEEARHEQKIFLEKETDFNRYLRKIQDILQQGSYYSNAEENVKRMCQDVEILTFSQFQRLFLVYEIYNRWAMELHININNHIFESIAESNIKDHALRYLIYKTIKVIETYPEFFSGGLLYYELPQYFFHEEVRVNHINNWFDLLLKDIKVTHSHITLEIRQTLFFWKHSDSLPLFKQTKRIPNSVKSILSAYEYKYYMDCKQYYRTIKKEKDLTNAIPPPFFIMDYMISSNGKFLYPLSRMSSGERQLLNSSSSIVYHLKNIAKSESNETTITYHNVNVILEEVELYFHPEYQRRFVKYLLEQIENAHLPAKMSINFMFVTHSPFILSDIPRQNVLFLKDGSPDRSMQEDTFGANIHTLLQNGFFLNSVPIGAFAKEKISQMFALLNQSGDIPEDSLNRLEKEIPLVSEPLLRSQLMRLFTMRKKFKCGDSLEIIAALEKRIQILEDRLHDKN